MHALRPAVAAQVILSFDPDIQEPRDLAGVLVDINEFTGSHHTVLQFLDGTLPREASLLEPYVSLALNECAHITAANFYRGAEVISPDLSPEQCEAYIAAVNEAADLSNAGFGRYKHYLVESVKDRIKPEEVGDHFVHYAHAKPMDEKRFDYTV